MPILRRHRYILLALGIYWPLIFRLTHIPIPDVARRSGMSDKTMHLLAYLALTFLFWLAVSPYRKVRWGRRAVWAVLAVMAGYAAVDELLQGRVGRSADLMDFAANLVGILLALGILSFLSFWPALLTVSAIFIFAVQNLSSALLLWPQYHLNTVFHFTAYAAFTLIWIQYDCRRCPLPSAGDPARRLWLWMGLPLTYLLFVKAVGVYLEKEFWWVDASTGVFAIMTAALISVWILRKHV